MVYLRRFSKLILLTLVIIIVCGCSTNDVKSTLVNSEKQNVITASFVESKREDLKGSIKVAVEVLTPKSTYTYHWFWGDGKKSMGESPYTSHNYEVSGNFTVRLVISVGGTNNSVSQQEIIITEEEITRVGGHKSPVAILSILEISQEQADEVIDSQRLNLLAQPILALAENQQRYWFWFDACKSYDPDGGAIANYKIEFGNRHYVQGQSCNVLYYYTNSEEYIVTLTVKDNQGAINFIEQTISW